MQFNTHLKLSEASFNTLDQADNERAGIDLKKTSATAGADGYDCVFEIKDHIITPVALTNLTKFSTTFHDWLRSKGRGDHGGAKDDEYKQAIVAFDKELDDRMTQLQAETLAVAAATEAPSLKAADMSKINSAWLEYDRNEWCNDSVKISVEPMDNGSGNFAGYRITMTMDACGDTEAEDVWETAGTFTIETDKNLQITKLTLNEQSPMDYEDYATVSYSEKGRSTKMGEEDTRVIFDFDKLEQEKRQYKTAKETLDNNAIIILTPLGMITEPRTEDEQGLDLADQNLQQIFMFNQQSLTFTSNAGDSIVLNGQQIMQRLAKIFGDANLASSPDVKSNEIMRIIHANMSTCSLETASGGNTEANLEAIMEIAGDVGAPLPADAAPSAPATPAVETPLSPASAGGTAEAATITCPDGHNPADMNADGIPETCVASIPQ